MCIYAQSSPEQRNDMADNSEQIIYTTSSINEKSGEAPSATASTHCINKAILSRRVIIVAILILFVGPVAQSV